ncbi:hypothetical protein C900_01830 [Fulvivirga imtechensis AK7]|uniref:Uncharacterized protein n=1 Tax=Fulvivirga imtechensis AK7 TaxID=1237149 RepID=L8JV48_9BACT|nr:contractile injection system tape measure protein [Fulvivirga imtechensis]ELR72088.1 hypothetical protein C900_01830 [Fulvivirga imtechensis AK7]
MASGKHIIHRQLIDIKVADKAEAQRWQNEFSAYYKSAVLQALERACDELCPENEHIRINKLEIDIGKISRGKLRPELTRDLVRKFQEEILKVASEKLYLVSQVTTSAKSGVPEGVATISGKTASLYDTVIYYLEYGMLPWWASAKGFNIHKSIDQLIAGNAGSLPEEQFFNKLRSLLIRQHCQLRVIDVCTTQQLNRCFDPRNDHSLLKFYKDFEKLTSRKDVKYTFFKNVLANATLVAPGAGFVIDKEKAVLNALRESGYTVEQKLPTLLSLIQEKTGLKSSLARLIDKLVKEKGQSASAIKNEEKEWESGKLNKEKIDPLKRPVSDNDHADPSISNDKAKLPAHRDPRELKGKGLQAVNKDRSQPQPSLPSDDAIEIANAGAVLLWPYLQMFYKELGLVERGAFVNEECQVRAVQLLHHLVSGETEAEEHQWLLFKLLCGMQPTDFVPTAFELSEPEQQECNNLLRSVIRNWAVLKNTSSEGLQSSFLRRPGLLKRDYNGWIVHIERIAIDVLLDRLTWPISVIRLPWNEKAIHVKW